MDSWFYLTRGHHSNNASATLHDVYSDRNAWFAHRTKCGIDSNWQGTLSGGEGSSTWLLKIWIEYIVHVLTCMYVYKCVHAAVIVYCVDWRTIH